MRAQDYSGFDATGLAALVSRGEVSPCELLEGAIGRLEAVERTVNPIAVRMFEIARSLCRNKPEGRFGGVPFLLKDCHQQYAGVADTGGSRARVGWIAETHGEYTRRCLRAGLVAFGRTTTSEFGLLATTETALHGPTRNPWSLDRSPGGSSGGAAAAVAAGLVPMAGASDGGGSIRIPAGYCGLFGFKPGRGLVPSGPDRAEGWEGANSDFVLTRSVRDAAAMLDVLAGEDVGAPYPAPARPRSFEAAMADRPAGLRVGFSTSSPVGPVHPACVAAVEGAARLLEGSGHAVEEVAMPVDLAEVGRAYLTLYLGQVPADVASARARTGASLWDLEPMTRALVRFGRETRACAYVEAHRLWNVFGRALGRFFTRYDLLMLPTTAGPPPLIGELAPRLAERVAMEALVVPGMPSLARRLGAMELIARRALERTPFTQLSNLTGTPSMSVPLHWEEVGEDGTALPFGVQFVAPMGGEALLLRLAAALEEAAGGFGRPAGRSGASLFAPQTPNPWFSASDRTARPSEPGSAPGQGSGACGPSGVQGQSPWP